MTNRRHNLAPPKGVEIQRDKTAGVWAADEKYHWQLHPTKGWKRRRHTYIGAQADMSKMHPLIRSIRIQAMMKGWAL